MSHNTDIDALVAATPATEYGLLEVYRSARFVPGVAPGSYPNNNAPDDYLPGSEPNPDPAMIAALRRRVSVAVLTAVTPAEGVAAETWQTDLKAAFDGLNW